MDEEMWLDSRVTALTLKTVTEIEELAEEILTDRAQIIELDKKRNSNREALRALHVKKSEKQWMCMGNMFIKLPKITTVQLLQDDQNSIDTELENLHKDLKPKVQKLHELEGLPVIKGFDLKSL